MSLRRRPTAVGWGNGGQPAEDNFSYAPADPTRSEVRGTMQAAQQPVTPSASVVPPVGGEGKPTVERKHTVIGVGDAPPTGVRHSPREHATIVAPAPETEHNVHRGFAKELTSALVEAGMNDLFANWIGIGQFTPEANREMVIRDMRKCGLDEASIEEFRNTGLLTHMPTIVPRSVVSSPTSAHALRTGSPTMPPPEHVAAPAAVVSEAQADGGVVLSDDARDDAEMLKLVQPRSNRKIIAAILFGLAVGGAAAVKLGIDTISNNINHSAPSRR